MHAIKKTQYIIAFKHTAAQHNTTAAMCNDYGNENDETDCTFAMPSGAI